MASQNNNRVNFASVKNPMPTPDFLDVQLKSFKDFLQLDTPPELRKNDGLYKVFSENFPITDTRNNFVLEFLDYFIRRVSRTWTYLQRAPQGHDETLLHRSRP